MTWTHGFSTQKGPNVIDGAHLLLFTTDPHSDQAALERILGTPVVPAGEDRVIIALPPGEIATHVTSDEFAHRHAGHDLQGTALYLMCNDLDDTIEGLESLGITCTEVTEEGFGRKTTIRLPSGAEIGLYEPSHERAISDNLNS